MTEPISDRMEREAVALAQALPREIEPPPEAWAAIHAQLGVQQSGMAPRLAWWQRPAFLAAAGLLLVVASSAVTASLLRDRAERTPAPMVVRSGSNGVAFAEFTSRENHYLEIVHTLVAAIEDETSGLSPETIATIRANLLVIDAAILETRQALAEDPANRQLMDILSATYEKKVDLLRRTNAMARS
jgi:hypothetical protein